MVSNTIDVLSTKKNSIEATSAHLDHCCKNGPRGCLGAKRGTGICHLCLAGGLITTTKTCVLVHATHQAFLLVSCLFSIQPTGARGGFPLVDIASFSGLTGRLSRPHVAGRSRGPGRPSSQGFSGTRLLRRKASTRSTCSILSTSVLSTSELANPLLPAPSWFCCTTAQAGRLP